MTPSQAMPATGSPNATSLRCRTRRPGVALLAALATVLLPAWLAGAGSVARAAPSPGAGNGPVAIVGGSGGTAVAPPPGTMGTCPALLDHRFTRLRDGQSESLCAYAGRVVLIVNTASKCGFTPQYEGLQALHERYSARGLTVLAFPSGDFLGQEHANRTDIAKTCFDQYGAKFMVYDRTPVVGRDANPLYAQLIAARGAPKWNFHKYLLDRDGKPVASFGSTTDPLDPKLTAAIERLLASPARAKG